MLRAVNNIRYRFTLIGICELIKLLFLILLVGFLFSEIVVANDLRKEGARKKIIQQGGSVSLSNHLSDKSTVEIIQSGQANKSEDAGDSVISGYEAGNNGFNLYKIETIPEIKGEFHELLKKVSGEETGEMVSDEERGVGNSPLIFVSFSLGESSISNYLVDARRYGATLVFRGFLNNDIQEHLKQLKIVIGDNEDMAGMVVDPTLFNRFNINTVPAFVVPESGIPACNLDGCGNVDYVKLSGAATIERYLEEIERRGGAVFSGIAKSILERGRARSEY